MKKKKIVKYSCSSMKTFGQCPRKFYYNYIEKLPKKTWEHNIIGSFAHLTLEVFHRNYTGEENLNDLMTDSFKKAAKVYKKNLNKSKILLVKGMLEKYLDKVKHNGMPDTIGVEKRFNFKLDGNNLIGIIDRIDKISGGYHVVDYKTSKSVKYMDDFQLLVYSLWAFNNYKKLKRIKASYVMLKLDCITLDYEFTRESAENRKDEILKYCRGIKEENEWKKNPGPLCPYCDFYSEYGGPCSGFNESNGWTVEI